MFPPKIKTILNKAPVRLLFVINKIIYRSLIYDYLKLHKDNISNGKQIQSLSEGTWMTKY